MDQSRRLITNTVAIYARMFLTVGVGLLVVRLLFRAMGEEGYGIFIALVASGAILAIVNTSLIASARRYLAFEIGTANLARQKEVFGILLTIFFAFSVIVLLVGLAVEGPLVRALTIPDSRLGSASWAFRVSMVNLAVVLAATPYVALLEAHQEFTVVALFELANRILVLAAVVTLSWTTIDPVLAYTVLLLAIGTMLSLSTSAYSFKRYPESRCPPSFPEWRLVRPIFAFAGWTVLSAATQLTQIKASMVLTNAYFGTSANAGFSLAHQAISYVMQLCTVLSRAVGPAATSSEGRGDADQMARMTKLVSRYSSYAIIAGGVPIYLEIHYLLGLWIGPAFPPLAVPFFELLLLFNAIQMLSWGDTVLADARASIGVLNSITLAAYSITFAAVWSVWHSGSSDPLLMMRAMCITTFIISVGFRPWWVGRMIDRAWPAFLLDVPARITAVAILPLIAGVVVKSSFEEGVMRIITIQLVVMLALAVGVLAFGVEAWEREAWSRTLGRVIRSMRRKA